MTEIREADPVIASVRMVMSAWREAIGPEHITVARVIKTATEQRRADSYEGRVEFVNEGLREALLVVAGRGGAINSRALGYWLSAHQGRIVDGSRFEQYGTRDGVTVWGLVNADP
jgi:putative DNA primase/helicase